MHEPLSLEESDVHMQSRFVPCDAFFFGMLHQMTGTH